MVKMLRSKLPLCCMGLVALEAHAVNPMAAAGWHFSTGLSADSKVDMWASNPVSLARAALASAAN